MSLKTFANWDCNMSEYLQIGDEVDQEFVDYFIDVLPPACMNNKCIQIGEPYSYKTDANGNFKATYSTLKKENGKWYYAGHCFRSETIEPKEEII